MTSAGGDATEYVRAAALGDVREGEVLGLSLNDWPIALYLVSGEVFCTTNVCTHDYSFLSDGGYVENGEVECAYHGARYDVRDGEVTAPPAVAPLLSFPVRVEGDAVYVALPSRRR